MMYDAIHHARFELRSAFLWGRPLELTKHGCDAACLVIVSSDKPGIAMLHHFQSVDVVLGVGIRYWAGILQEWTHKGHIAKCLHLSWTWSDISLKKSTGGVCFLCCGFDVICPVEIVLEMDAKIFCCV